MKTCEIRWIDKQGNPTDDTNPATYRVRTMERFEWFGGKHIRFEQSRWFNCCAEHATRLSEPGMHNWECEAVLP